MSEHERFSTAVVEGHHAHFDLDAVELKVVAGPSRGLVVQLAEHSLLLGSAPSCDVVLADRTVSSRHAEIVVTANGYAVRDLGSKNGITLNSFPIERAPLSHGMRIGLGTSVISVKALGKRLSVALSQPGEVHGLVAHSVKMRAFVAALTMAAASDATVLLEGETGVGKELAAEALHMAGSRARGPFVVFDCGAIQRDLISAELFGHERGAFTGAGEARAGLLEQADGGTLFIDEIGELPLEVQPMLLGALERRRARRIGGTKDVSVDLRFIAATNRNLAEEVRMKRFREDLFYRLSVLRLRIPPLRERREDILLLADRFARDAGVQLSPDLLGYFSAHSWPGNVRELKNTVARVGMVASPLHAVHGVNTPEPPRSQALFFDDGKLRPMSDARRASADEFERAYVRLALDQAEGNVSRAAQLASLSRSMFSRLLAKHDLRLRDKA